MMEADTLLASARTAFQRREWVAAREEFARARAVAPLSADDAYALADAAWWLGLVDEALQNYEQAYDLFVAEGLEEQAALTAFGISYTYSLRGDETLSSAWGGRAMRHVEALPECAVHGFLAYVSFESALSGGDLEGALEHARTAGALGERFGEPNLRALGILGEGRVRVREGRVAEGMALLDEAMLAALSPELDPSWVGNIYCHLMLTCHELADLRRAADWTRATARWCESMPGAGPFMGICRVHRAQVLQVQGEWQQAESEVRRVCAELSHFHVSIVAEVYYELGELCRRRGDLRGAEDAFAEAHRRGRNPQPGLALVRMAQGNLDAAASALDGELAYETGPLLRVRPLSARVEVALAARDWDTARAGATELQATANHFGSSGLLALAAHLNGAVLLAEGSPAAALPLLREGFRRWHELGAPYETARVRLLLAAACEALGDRDTARLEREAAEAALRTLQLATPTASPAPEMPAGLTPRELEVLLLAAEGLSNSDIAQALVLSVRTVERHLATVYSKLGFEGRTARAAAIALAHRQGFASVRTPPG